MVQIGSNLSLFTTKAVIILDSEGKRILSKYYTNDFLTVKDQKAFEKSLFEKTKRSNSEIIMFDGRIVVYKSSIDVFIYAVGDTTENELILNAVLQTFYDSLSILLKTQVERRMMMENLDLVLLALDETLSDGMLLESEPSTIASRVTKRPDQEGTHNALTSSGLPLSEQTLGQFYQQAKEQLQRSLR